MDDAKENLKNALPTDAVNRLVDEFSRVADGLRQQNSLRRRLMHGIVFGVGTAIGASVVASLVILLLSSLLAPLGLETAINPN